MVFKGYIPTKNKEALMRFKNKKRLPSLDDVKDLEEYAGILADDIIMVDFDDPLAADIMFDIVEAKDMNCRVYQTTRGKHFLFKNKNRKVDQSYTHVNLACGLEADIKVGHKNSYEVLKFKGKVREIVYDVDNEEFDEIPYWLYPVKSKTDFLEMSEGDGRNSKLFGYELTLQSAGFSKEQAIETIQIINNHVLKEPLPKDELDVVLRDDAFAKPIFFEKNKFLHNVFAEYLKSELSIKRINGMLYCFNGKIYVSAADKIEGLMLKYIPQLRQTQRTEVVKYIERTTEESEVEYDVRFIAFRNGLLNLETMEIQDFTPDYMITNLIPHDYNANAYSELADRTLNKLACFDKQIRAVLEECIGYCFYRRNEMSKAFILTGASGANGKSTFLDMVKYTLGSANYSVLDISELDDRFSITTMSGKLANIGDDISDEFLHGKTVSQFKKVVSGNELKAERKGQDVYNFKPTVKLLFSANEIPRVRNKGFKAILRRLVIIPFNAHFSDKDADYDPLITWKLQTPEVAEYLIKIGIDGLQRVLAVKKFTESAAVEEELETFERENNPVIMWLDELEDKEAEIVDHPTKDVFLRYSVWCQENGCGCCSASTFTREIKRLLNLDRKNKRDAKDGRVKATFVKG
jgi:putative DNA primase/helicase